VLRQLKLTLVGAADPNENARHSFLSSCPEATLPFYCSNITDLLSHRVPDLLVIATTADGRAAHTLQAVRAGVRLILLEKPVSNSLASCRELHDACLTFGARIAVNHQMRFLPQYQIPKDLLVSPALGGFCSMHVAAGNFGMAMNGIHYLEAFRYLANEAPNQVSAWFDPVRLPNPRGSQFQDVSGCISVTTESGRRLFIDASADQGHGVQVTYMGRNGRITVDELTGAMTTVVRSSEHRDAPTSRYGMPVEIEQHQIPPIELVESTKAVVQALLAGEGYPTLADATLAVKTLVAAYHSHRQGGVPVRLADIADDDPEVFPWA